MDARYCTRNSVQNLGSMAFSGRGPGLEHALHIVVLQDREECPIDIVTKKRRGWNQISVIAPVMRIMPCKLD